MKRSGNDDAPTIEARMDCLRWLKECLKLGWSENQLTLLEILWWQHHDSRGRLK